MFLLAVGECDHVDFRQQRVDAVSPGRPRVDSVLAFHGVNVSDIDVGAASGVVLLQQSLLLGVVLDGLPDAQSLERLPVWLLGDKRLPRTVAPDHRKAGDRAVGAEGVLRARGRQRAQGLGVGRASRHKARAIKRNDNRFSLQLQLIKQMWEHQPTGVMVILEIRNPESAGIPHKLACADCAQVFDRRCDSLVQRDVPFLQRLVVQQFDRRRRIDRHQECEIIANRPHGHVVSAANVSVLRRKPEVGQAGPVSDHWKQIGLGFFEAAVWMRFEQVADRNVDLPALFDSLRPRPSGQRIFQEERVAVLEAKRIAVPVQCRFRSAPSAHSQPLNHLSGESVPFARGR